jgi:hypothetical protein
VMLGLIAVLGVRTLMNSNKQRQLIGRHRRCLFSCSSE